MVPSRDTLYARYTRIRRATEKICTPLETDDMIVQPTEFVSPPKWHLGHTTRFIEEHLIDPFRQGYVDFDPIFPWVFAPNETLGHRAMRRLRGTLARPTLEHIQLYRAHVDGWFKKTLDLLSEDRYDAFAERTELALQHELVHQEALLADIKYILFTTPGLPSYKSHRPEFSISPGDLGKSERTSGGIHRMGFDGDSFCFDDERPGHDVIVAPFRLHSSPVTNGEYLEFVEQQGYHLRSNWSDEGWEFAQRDHWHAPLYWLNLDGAWWEYCLDGLRPIDLVSPVSHVSYYEAEAYAKWVGKRLPTEVEWEIATHACEDLGAGNFAESGLLHPGTSPHDSSSHRLLGDVWEWTSSHHLPYPGNENVDPAHRASIGNYGTEFRVLRGGSCISPRESVRVTTRNEQRPEMRWQFTGIRLAEDA
jgi:ergothioneine biosynthesis protein EgtB